MTPFYQDPLVTLFRGDARVVLPRLDVTGAVVITDPVWPNAVTAGDRCLVGSEDPAGLFADVVRHLAAVRLLVVTLGCNCDPRFLAAVPAALPFARVTHLRHAVPTYAGPIIKGADVAYVFGSYRRAAVGQKVWPGEIVSTRSRAREPWTSEHPCPRPTMHVDGIVGWYAHPDELLVDPFAGSGTLVESAVRRRRRVVAIEIEERWCSEIVRRIRWAEAQQTIEGIA